MAGRYNTYVFDLEVDDEHHELAVLLLYRQTVWTFISHMVTHLASRPVIILGHGGSFVGGSLVKLE